jgi:NhaP-type Na+/H+ or K+/H+ antiporter
VPISILLGSGLGLVLFDDLNVFDAAVLGTILAATDATLGKAMVTNPAVPDRLREGLIVESGLNDGFCVPVLFVFIALELGSEASVGDGLVLKLLAQELGVGALVGLSVAAVGAFLMRRSARVGWIDPVWSQITTGALALTCFAMAQSLHVSGYIASFTGGLLFGHLMRGETSHLVEPAEGIGEVLALLTWFLFGSAVVGQAFSHFSWTIALYALLSLTAVRMLPVYLCMAGSGESPRARWFMGWFGPRGMASIVFAIIVLDEGLKNAEFIALVVACTVLLSLVLHGISAWKYANWLGRREPDHS